MSASGQVVRDFSKQPEAWSSAKVGAEFEVGDAVRTLPEAGAQVALDDGSVLVVDEDTVIRFLEREPGKSEHNLDLLMGGAVLEAQSETTLVTSFGRARLGAGGKIRLTRSGEGLSFRVMVGSATLEAAGGKPIEVEAGQTVLARLGSAVFETVDEALNTEEQKTESDEVEAADPVIEPLSGPITAMVAGNTVQLKAPSDSGFSRWTAGSQNVELGSLVKVGAGSSVQLTQGEAQAELSAGGTYMVGANGQLVQAQSGSFRIRADQKLRLAVPGGFIETTAGEAQVTALGKDGTEVTVKSGSARLIGKTRETLSTGELGRIAGDGAVTVSGRGLGRYDLQVVAGASLVIHDPHPPTAVGFGFGKQCEQGVVRLSSRQKSAISGEDFARGTQLVSLAIGPGRVDYTLTCLEDGAEAAQPRVKGTVTVLADAGTKPVPSNAPSTMIDANGLSYTVLYQNQLPRVSLRWPGAPSGVSSFKFIKTSGGRSSTYTSAAPSYTFASGAFGEGTHRVYVEGGGRVSRLTTVNISFDNATPTASLQTPVNAGGAPGSSLRLSGSVLPGWAITVDGAIVSPDAEGRFSVTTQMPPQGRPALLFLAHPERGFHVYLRRGRGAQ